MSNQRAKAEDHGSGAVLRVLILEDVPRDADMVERALRKAGVSFESRRVETREDFLEGLDRFAPDIVLSDYTLPSFDGMRALQLAQERAPLTPFILVTAMNEEVAVECMKAGAADYVTKEHLVRLAPATRAALARASVRREKESAERALGLSHRLLGVANRHTAMAPLLTEFATEIRAFVGCEAVGIRMLDEEGSILYQTQMGFNQGLNDSETSIWTKSDPCMCINVMNGTPDPALPSYTPGGSLYVNGTTRFLATLSEEEKERTRKVYSEFGYESVALVPIRTPDCVLGLIHVADSRENVVSPRAVEALESAGLELGAAITRVRAETDRIALESRLIQAQKLESIATLASGIAHEINNPINGIMNYAQLIKERLQEGDQNLAEFAGEIIHEVDGVGTITRNLLQFARQDQESSSIALTSPAAIVQATLSLIRAVMRRDQITLDVDVPEDLPQITCRSQQIQQILMNLMTNALDAVNEKYEGYAENKIIRLSAQCIDSDHTPLVRLTVEDHGHGISDEVCERIFDPFFTTKGRDQGTGLGLSISHGIAAEHGGRLTVESEVGQYTRFHLDLPVGPGPEA